MNNLFIQEAESTSKKWSDRFEKHFFKSILLYEAQAYVIMNALRESACSDEQASNSLISSLYDVYPDVVLKYKNNPQVKAILDKRLNGTS